MRKFFFIKILLSKKILLCTISAILIILSFPDFNLFPLPFICLIPLLIAINNEKKSVRFLYGLITGTIAYCGILYWLIPTFISAEQSIILAVFCLLLLSAYCALYIGIFCILTNFLNTLPSIIYILSSGCTWVMLEYIRTHFSSGFPWAVLGYSQWNFLPIIQISEFTGVYGVSFIIVLTNVTISKFLNSRTGIRNKSKFFIPVFVILGCYILYGVIKLNSIDDSETYPETYNVACLQGNIDQYKKWNTQFKNQIISEYALLVNKTIPEKPDLIIWPESAIPGYLLNEIDLLEWIRKVVRDTKCYHLIGSVEYDRNKYYNSAFLFSPEGKFMKKYSKIHLVPFGESIPFKSTLSRYIDVLNELGDFSPGNEYSIFHIRKNGISMKFGANICFESIFPYISRKLTNEGAEIIVNITNDAWYLKTSAARQHFVFNIFRAVENRRSVVRCANTGITGLIDEYGRIIVETRIFTTETVNLIVSPNNQLTLYTRYGDVFALLCIVLTCISILIRLICVTEPVI